jgi:hypothetical protein
MRRHQYYLHENGQLIHKPITAIIEGDLVRDWFWGPRWTINTENRGACWLLCIEAAALGANIDRIKDLADKWGLTFEDSINFLAWMGKPEDWQKKGLELFVTEVLGYKTLDEYLDAALIAGNAKQQKERERKESEQKQVFKLKIKSPISYT